MKAILSQIQSAVYETNHEGRFLEPDQALAEFFLGAGKQAEDLRGCLVSQFYVIQEQRRAFLARLRAGHGKPITDYVLLRLPGGDAWCRCRSAWTKKDGEDRYTGLVVQLEPEDDWLPGQLLARTGWAYLRVNRQGVITYASSLNAKLLGVPDPTRLVGQRWGNTHWLKPDECAEFLRKAWDRDDHAKHHTRIVDLQRDGRGFRAEIQARIRERDIPEAQVLEVEWREVSEERLEEDARFAALSLRERVDSLKDFEQAIVETVAAQCSLKTAAFYRFYENRFQKGIGQYILRAAHGIHAGNNLLQQHDIEPGGEEPMANSKRFLRTSAGDAQMREILVPVYTPDKERIGCVWVPLAAADGTSSERWVRAFSKYLGVVVEGAEKNASERASARALNQAVEILLSGDTSVFYGRFLKLLIEDLSAEAGSIFEIRRVEGKRVLQLVASTGIEGYTSVDWHEITYQLGEGLTGRMANEREPVSLLDVNRELGSEPRYVERIAHRPPTWLGCPIFADSAGELIGYIRLINRLLTKGEHVESTGFSSGDLKLIEQLAHVAGKYHVLQTSLHEHQQAIVRSAHELHAPLVAIRSHAYFLRKNLEHPAAPAKCENIQADAELLQYLLETIDSAAPKREPELEATSFYGQIIRPLQVGLNELAKRRGYAGLEIDADGLRPLPLLQVDRSMMRQVFYNLIVNAIQYGPPPSPSEPVRVEVTATLNVDKWICHIAVRDWGIGIPHDRVHKIFDQYYRTRDAIKRDPSGSGIGLFVVRELVKKHGGAIHVRKNAGLTEFAMTIQAKEGKR